MRKYLLIGVLLASLPSTGLAQEPIVPYESRPGERIQEKIVRACRTAIDLVPGSARQYSGPDASEEVQQLEAEATFGRLEIELRRLNLSPEMREFADYTCEVYIAASVDTIIWYDDLLDRSSGRSTEGSR